MRIRKPKYNCIDCQGQATSLRCQSCHFKQRTGSAHPNWKGAPRNHYLYQTFHSIKTRCYNQKRHDYKWYGGRGINLYEPWRQDFWLFANWIEENLGTRPEGHTLDRIDTDGNYEPGNLRWATQSQQVSNSWRARKDAGNTV